MTWQTLPRAASHHSRWCCSTVSVYCGCCLEELQLVHTLGYCAVISQTHLFEPELLCRSFLSPVFIIQQNILTKGSRVLLSSNTTTGLRWSGHTDSCYDRCRPMGTAGAEADLSRLKVQQQDLGMGTLYTGDYCEPVKHKPHTAKAF